MSNKKPKTCWSQDSKGCVLHTGEYGRADGFTDLTKKIVSLYAQTQEQLRRRENEVW